MFDVQVRKLIDPPLEALANGLSRTNVTANQVTLLGFALGMFALPLLAAKLYMPALVLIAANRLLDGLDGALARVTGATDTGAYLDIVFDFVFYSAVIFGFALGRPEDALYAAFLIFSFVGTGSSFLAFAIFAAKRDLVSDATKSIYYLGGLTEGTETVIALVLICVFPGAFWLIALIFGLMCWITTTFRILAAVKLTSRD